MKRLTFISLVLISIILVASGCSETKMRNSDNPIVTIETDFGKMVFELYRDVAPAHVDSFLARTDEGFYDSLLFFRIIKNFMIQSGDPNNNGTGGAGYNLEAEFNELPHIEGTLSMARGYAENSAGTQFFICLARNSKTEYLDGKYTVFGQLLEGSETLQEIGAVPVEAQPHGEVSRPKEPVYLIKAYRSDINGNPL
ncbi:MAG: peptidylprolyl isomerase [candidate division Zixibacteria bacterium]|nr:peptidylprolyl isomerase [candidate division Zixibacteria bacterium]